MKHWRTEYKFLLTLVAIFAIILSVFLIKGGYVSSVQRQQRQKQLVHCTEEEYEKGIQYTTYTCTIQDEYGESYTIEYPQIEEKSKDIKNLNKRLKKNFDQVYKSIEYLEIDEKLQLQSYQKMNFRIFYSRGIISFLIESQDLIGTVSNKMNQYYVYNIDSETYEILDENESKEKLGIDRDYSSTLKGNIVKMYLENFRYDYNNELDVYRNTFIDDSIQSVTYQAIQNIYVDDTENIHFILYLFNPDYGDTVPYNFSIDSLGNINYEILQ